MASTKFLKPTLAQICSGCIKQGNCYKVDKAGTKGVCYSYKSKTKSIVDEVSSKLAVQMKFLR